VKTVEFRDGDREVPDHVAALLKGLETHTMTYDQALRVSEKRLLSDRLNQMQGDLVAEHFKGMR
jgi:hypothetical protein